MDLIKKLLSASSPSHEDEEPIYYPALRAGDYTAALPLVNEAVKQEDRHAMGVLATMYAMGYGVKRDLDEAALWFRQAAVRGELFAQTAFGTCLAAGHGVPVDRQEGAYWLFKAANGGHRMAAEILGDLVMKDQTVVGKYFTMDAVADLVLQARKPAQMH